MLVSERAALGIPCAAYLGESRESFGFRLPEGAHMFIYVYGYFMFYLYLVALQSEERLVVAARVCAGF